jgi:hypothetical protein
MLVMEIPRHYGRFVLLAIFVAVDLLLGASVVRWPFRARWAGPLLKDLTLPRDRNTWVACAGAALALTTFLAVQVHPIRIILYSGSSWGDRKGLVLTSFLALGFLIARGFLSAGRVELRQRGALLSGIWVPWSSVESYAWKETGGAFTTLRVRSRRWLLALFGSTMLVFLPAAQKSPADAILKRQLAEWPGS